MKNIPDPFQIRFFAIRSVCFKNLIERARIPLRQRAFDLNPIDPNRGFVAIAVSIHRRVKVKLPQLPPRRLTFSYRKLPFRILTHLYLGLDQFRIGRTAGNVQRLQRKTIQLPSGKLPGRGVPKFEEVTKRRRLFGDSRSDTHRVRSDRHFIGWCNYNLCGTQS